MMWGRVGWSIYHHSIWVIQRKGDILFCSGTNELSHVQDDYCRPSESAPGKEHATNMSIYWWLFESAHTTSLLVYRLGYGPFKAEGESMMISQDKTFCTLTFKLRNIELKFCSCWWCFQIEFSPRHLLYDFISSSQILMTLWLYGI